MGSFNLKGVGAVQATASTGALTVPMPSGGGAPSPGDLILILAGTRTLSGGYSADPTSSGYTLLKQGTGFVSGNAIWGKLASGGEGSVTVTTSVSGCISFAAVVTPVGGAWPAISSIIGDSPASTQNNLTNSGIIRMQAITPSASNLLVVRLSTRLVQTTNTVTAVAASSNFVNTDGTHNSWAYYNNSTNGQLLAAEFRVDGSNAANAVSDNAVTTISDPNTDTHLQIAITLQATFASPYASVGHMSPSVACPF